MTTTAGTTLPTAPDLLIEAADTIGNRSAERDNADGERSMNRAVQMFNAWRGQRGHSPMSEADGWAFMVFLKLARAAEGKHRRDDWVDGAAFDNVILRRAYQRLPMETPWSHWNDRCYRTIKGLYGSNIKIERRGTHHHALADAEAQAVDLLRMLDCDNEQRPYGAFFAPSGECA